MTIKIGINGFGRIGRMVFRAAIQNFEDIEVVGINDLLEPDYLAYMLNYDSVHGRFKGDISVDGNTLIVSGKRIRLTQEKDPANLKWAEAGATVVIESTGLFLTKETAQKHLDAGAKKVVISAPATDPDVTLVLGVNDGDYDPEAHHIVSNASCTTNCVAPLAKVVDDLAGIESGFMTTIHAYTNDQNILDLPHKDLRRARAAAINLIPTSTGAAKAIGLVMPHLQGKVDGVSVRAPVPTGSLTDLVVTLGREVTRDEVDAAYRAAAADGPLAPVLLYSEDPLVSTDIVGNPHSCIFDSLMTMSHGRSVKVFGWYDNEWGYSCRLADLVELMARKLAPETVGVQR